MTPPEREQLTCLLQQMTQTQAGQKDAEADALIRNVLVRQSDADYLLAQRAMVLDYVLQVTRTQAASSAAASSWGSGMLASVATTAAGVVAGAFLSQGIQGLMSHHGAGLGDNVGHAGANATAPDSGGAPLGDAPAGASDDAADYAAMDGGDVDSGDVA